MSNSEQLIINVAGKKGSGKTSAAQHLERQHGFKLFEPEAIVQHYAPGRVISPMDYAKYQRELLENDPEAFITPLRAMGHPNICIDGLLVPSQAETLRNLPDIDYRTLAMVCHDELRVRRIRDHSTSPYEWRMNRATLERDEAQAYNGADPYDINVEQIMAMHEAAGWEVSTDGTRLGVNRTLDSLVGQLACTSQQG
jgi:cytidylate kinase